MTVSATAPADLPVVLFMVTMAALGFVAQVLRKSGDSSSQIAATMTGA